MELATRIISAPVGHTYLFFTGQAGYIIKGKNGKLLGIDLYLSNCVERLEGTVGYKRLFPQLLHSSDLNFDWLVATHPHYDHFDADAIPELMANGQTTLFASQNCREELERLKMQNSNVVFVSAGDKFIDNNIKLFFVNCDHGSAAPDAVGVLVEVDGFRILEVGDTCLRLDFIDNYLEYGQIDVLIAPINGKFGNLDEHECAVLSKEIHPKLTIPCHYGMFANHGGNVGNFLEYMDEECPENKILLMTQGEMLRL